MPRMEIKFDSLAPRLPAEIVEHVRELIPEGDIRVKRSASARAVLDVDEGERAALVYASTREVDRDREILDPDGAMLEEYRLNPVVLRNHDYGWMGSGQESVIAKAPNIESDGYGLKAKVEFAPTQAGEEAWQLAKGGFKPSWSVGFVALGVVRSDDEQWKETVARYREHWGVGVGYFKEVRAIYTKWLLLEFSHVAVPANPSALTLEVAKAFGLSVEEAEDLTEQEICRLMNQTPGEKDNSTNTHVIVPARRLIPAARVFRHIPARLDVAATVRHHVREELLKHCGRP